MDRNGQRLCARTTPEMKVIQRRDGSSRRGSSRRGSTCRALDDGLDDIAATDLALVVLRVEGSARSWPTCPRRYELRSMPARRAETAAGGDKSRARRGLAEPPIASPSIFVLATSPLSIMPYFHSWRRETRGSPPSARKGRKRGRKAPRRATGPIEYPRPESSCAATVLYRSGAICMGSLDTGYYR